MLAGSGARPTTSSCSTSTTGYGDALVARLNRFRIRVKADVEPLPWRVIAVRGVDGVDDVVGPDPTARGRPRGHARRARAARIEAGWPAMGAEIVPGETIPAETGVTDVAVDFRKGCYPGQELVERMDSRGAVRAAPAARPRRRRRRRARRPDRRSTAPRSAC